MVWVTEMKWVGRARGWETMKMNKKYFGNSVLITWLLFCLWAGVITVETQGDWLASNGLFTGFILLWVLVLFLGRFAFEWVINKLWVTS